MNTIPRTLRATATCALFLLILSACGCRSTSHAQPASPFAANPAANGTSLDDIDARNRANISAQLGRPFKVTWTPVPDREATSTLVRTTLVY